MIDNYYPTIKRLIDEYHKDRGIFAAQKEIFLYYPQLFILTMVSQFEKEIKNKTNDVISNPIIPLPQISRQLDSIVLRAPNKYIDRIYGKFIAHATPTGILLSATDFYNLFGGQSFKIKIERYFTQEKQVQVSEYQKIISFLSPLLNTSEDYNEKYAENDEILNIIQNLTFSEAETAFLELKLRRNKVAHDFFGGTTDTFEDIKKLYYQAVLFIVALKKGLSDFSTI